MSLLGILENGLPLATTAESTEADEMNKAMYVQLAPIQRKDGVDDKMLLEASNTFESNFVRKQSETLKRVLLKGKRGGYADLVFFESKDGAERVAKAEETSEACREFFKTMETPAASLPDMAVLSFEHMKTYE
jgi:hypothetical protein